MQIIMSLHNIQKKKMKITPLGFFLLFLTDNPLQGPINYPILCAPFSPSSSSFHSWNRNILQFVWWMHFTCKALGCRNKKIHPLLLLRTREKNKNWQTCIYCSMHMHRITYKKWQTTTKRGREWEEECEKRTTYVIIIMLDTFCDLSSYDRCTLFDRLIIPAAASRSEGRREYDSKLQFSSTQLQTLGIQWSSSSPPWTFDDRDLTLQVATLPPMQTPCRALQKMQQ